ncbi:MAG: hypothetical protein HY077_01410 [Elusimicrobia bacterium]|nr:hypothetical protein [Elusimicrobiota bacterium]
MPEKTIVEIIWHIVHKDIARPSASVSVFGVGSASSTKTLRPGADLDLVVVLPKVTSSSLRKLRRIVTENLGAIPIGPSTHFALELRHGPFKPPRNVGQLHLLLHDRHSIQRVPIITRMDWAIGARPAFGVAPVLAMNLNRVRSDDLWKSLILELHNLRAQVEYGKAYYRAWGMTSNAGEMVLRRSSMHLKRQLQWRAFARYVIRAAIADASILAGRKTIFSGFRMLRLIKRVWPGCVSMWQKTEKGSRVGSPDLLAFLSTLTAWASRNSKGSCDRASDHGMVGHNIGLNGRRPVRNSDSRRRSAMRSAYLGN